MEQLNSFKKTITFVLLVLMFGFLMSLMFSDAAGDNELLEALREQYAQPHIPSVDHALLRELQRDFDSPHEVTAACLSCHTGRGEEVMNTVHWNWEREEYIEGKGIAHMGKKNLINNFCISTLSNEGTCMRCHIGYGWSDKTFDFDNPFNIDCLVCHDRTGTYHKASGGAGYPPTGAEAPDYRNIVQNVGLPDKYNCGVCHFMGGGGNNVKHGDLEMALLNSNREVDVHMAKDGLDMRCVDCHVTERHQIRGKYFATSTTNRNRIACTDCHTSLPHHNSRLNEHTVTLDCRACHIPKFAKVNATKMYWDWTTAGKLEDGEPFTLYDSMGNISYLSIKGDFVWERNVIPEYVWFNGTANRHLLTDKITTDTLHINALYGSHNDATATIVPVKVHRGKQPYDPVNKTLIPLKKWDREEGKGAFWTDFDWDAAVAAGMDYANLPYSGTYDFINTKVHLPVSHMVSKAEDALQCADCHTRNNSRMKNVQGVYLPGMSYNATLNRAGMAIIIMALAGVIIHALIRIFTYRKNNI